MVARLVGWETKPSAELVSPGRVVKLVCDFGCESCVVTAAFERVGERLPRSIAIAIAATSSVKANSAAVRRRWLTIRRTARMLNGTKSASVAPRADYA